MVRRQEKALATAFTGSPQRQGRAEETQFQQALDWRCGLQVPGTGVGGGLGQGILGLGV